MAFCSQTSTQSLNNFLLFLAFLFIFFLLTPSTESLSFRITSFDPNATNIIYEGDAVPFNGEIRMNRVDYITRVGRATHSEHVHIWDPDNGNLTDFTTNFSFIIDTLNRSVGTYGNGLVFFLAPVDSEIPSKSVGGFLGLFNTTFLLSPSKNKILGVEFDSNSNPAWDPPGEHVGFIINSLSSAEYVSWNASMHSLDVANAQVSYKSSTKKLNLILTYNVSPSRYNVSLDVDLRTILPEWVKIGFSSATGSNIELHHVLSWEFSSTLEGKEIIDANTSIHKPRNIKLILGLAVPLGVVVAAVAALAWVILKRGKKKEEEEGINITSINGTFDRGWPKKFSHGELVLATTNFSDEKKLGEGGFGGVYKGYLNDLDLMVAVKKISRGSKQGKREYVTEVKIISRLRHRNLVQLIGWCHDKGEFLLVYEFMPNRSLDTHLFGKKNILAWPIRYKIAVGLASALLYLHEEWEQCVIHRDIKPGNVMLDSGFNAKLGDFGLARLMDHELSPRTTVLAGTFGYLAPEYISSGRASKESDVYSFGVVALEIASGRKSVAPSEEDSRMKLVDWVWNLYGNGRLLDAADERLGVEFDAKQMECLMIVGLWCAHPDHNLRPSIRQVILVLHFEAAMPNLPSNMPVASYTGSSSPPHSSQPSITTSSIALGR
ncbi:L-type lectin-domain-containing protein [Cinnamomum micranthum f. kanehirae]|uniref:L-type lectin-domain-containing protein n=1 Tax=Cinnamomum micranthum f. kanehirae TaxID=337451 RepID=A0A3S4N8U0_9MAGN|nr:L-type lectin-domain-containing protein [Cinnamomum micranthum f. kanehirae]